MAKKSNKLVLPIVIILTVAVGALGYKYATQPDQRTTEEKVQDAMQELQTGFEKAAEQLEDRRPIDEINDVSKEMMEDIKNVTEAPKEKP